MRKTRKDCTSETKAPERLAWLFAFQRNALLSWKKKENKLDRLDVMGGKNIVSSVIVIISDVFNDATRD